MIRNGGINKFIIKVDTSLDGTIRDWETGQAVMGENNKPLYLANQYTPRWHSTQIATIVALPLRIDDKYNDVPECKVGDELIIHYNVTNAFDEETQKLINEFYYEGERYFYCEPPEIWGLIRGDEIIPFGNRVFLDKIKNEEKVINGIIIPPSLEFDDRHGIVRFFNEQGNGLTKGDKALLIEGGYNEVLVKNKRYLCVYQSTLYGKIEGEELIPYGNFSLVEPEQIKTSLIIPEAASSVKPINGTIRKVGAKTPKHLFVGRRVGFRPARHPMYNGMYILSEDRIHYGEISSHTA